MRDPLFFLFGASSGPPWAELPRLARQMPFLIHGRNVTEKVQIVKTGSSRFIV